MKGDQMRGMRFEVTPAGKAALQQSPDTGRASSYKIGYGEPEVLRFIQECYDWWRDGCNCVACRVINSYEADGHTDHLFHARMKILSDAHGATHGDGCWYGELLLRSARRS